MRSATPLGHTSRFEAWIDSHLPLLVGLLLAGTVIVASAAETAQAMDDGESFASAFLTPSGIGVALFAVPALISAAFPGLRVIQVFTLLVGSLFSILRADVITLQPLVWFICSALLGWQYGYFTPERAGRTVVIVIGYFAVWTTKVAVTAFRDSWGAIPFLLGGFFAVFVVWAILVLQTRLARERAAELDDAVRLRTTELEQALKVKGQLLRELHHSSKSNLQMISSMLQFEHDALDTAETALAIEQTQRRLHAASRLYDRLISSPDPGSINLSDYLRDFLDDLAMSNSNSGVGFVQRVELPNTIIVTTEFALRVGIALNELSYCLIERAEGAGAGTANAQIFGEISEREDQLSVRLVLNVSGSDGAAPSHTTDRMSVGAEIAEGLIRAIGGTLEGSMDAASADGEVWWQAAVPLEKPKQQAAVLSSLPTVPRGTPG